MSNNKDVLIFMYAPWCGWCKRIAADYIKVADHFANENMIDITTIDSTVHTLTHPKLQIRGFPTVVLFKKNDKDNPVEYNGDRSSADMIKFVKANVDNIKLNITDSNENSIITLTNNFKEVVMDNNKNVIIMFFAEWCHWCEKMLPDYKKLPDHFKDSNYLSIVVANGPNNKDSFNHDS